MKKGAAAGAETGVCALCGRNAAGTPAKPDFVIMAARKARALLKLAPVRTVACGDCLQACMERRSAFEKRRWRYRVLAAAFFLFLSAGGIFLGGAGAWAIVPAALGAGLVLTIPYASYAPEFQKNGKEATSEDLRN